MTKETTERLLLLCVEELGFDTTLQTLQDKFYENSISLHNAAQECQDPAEAESLRLRSKTWWIRAERLARSKRVEVPA